MIRHCVFVHYQPAFERPAREAIYRELAALRQQLPGMLGVTAGPNVSPEGLGKGFEEGFIVDFVDAAARDAYLIHPDHQALGARLVAAAQGGVAGIMVFDLAV